MKKCPHCGGTQFKAVIKRPGIVDLSGDEMKILKEGSKVAYEVWACASKSCGKDVTNDDLVGDCKCSACGKEVDEKYAVDGVCIECKMKEEIPDFDNMDPMAKMMYIYNLKKGAESKGTVNKADKIEAKGQAKTEEKKAKEVAKESAKEEVKEEPKTEEKKEEASPTPSRRRGHTAHKPVESKKETEAPPAAAEDNDIENTGDESITPPELDNIDVPF